MKAALFEEFGKPISIKNVPDPTPEPDAVVVKVMANGICRSDWHGWMGHDPDIVLPHVPGHELSGIVEETGKNITRWKKGDRVTVPFVGGCGHCYECLSGNHQVCDEQFQPGFTHWGSFAEYVAIKYADINLVHLPDQLDFTTAASLGCRFATSFRAVVAQAKISAGEWIAVHGCGGVGLSAIMIAHALGAGVIAIDINNDALKYAKKCGADIVLNTASVDKPIEAIKGLTQGGTHVSIDALGNPQTCFNSISCLRKRGRHVQIGLMLAEQSTPKIPMAQVIGNELEIYGSHGMQAYEYDKMLQMILTEQLDPKKLISKTVSLEESTSILENMNNFNNSGVIVIDTF